MLEGDIKACFDEIDHTALMDRVRDRIGDKRVLGLVKAFLRSGILSEDGGRSGRRPALPKARYVQLHISRRMCSGALCAVLVCRAW